MTMGRFGFCFLPKIFYLKGIHLKCIKVHKYCYHYTKKSSNYYGNKTVIQPAILPLFFFYSKDHDEICLRFLHISQVAKENADVVIMDDNFKTIVVVARWGRSVYINIQKFVQFQLTVNVVALMTNFVSACTSGQVPSLCKV